MLPLPRSASTHAPAIDAMMTHLHLVILMLFAGWTIYFLYLLIRYRAGRQPVAKYAGPRGRLAIVFTALVVLTEGFLLITTALPLWFERTARRPSEPAPLVIRVIGEQFAWNIHYAGPDGQFGETAVRLISPENPIGLDRASKSGADDVVTVGEMHVPINQPVLAELFSRDVIHSFGIPAMRVKQDVTPGIRTPTWFTPTELGEFEIACSQLCGLGHHRMRAVIRVQTREEFDSFLRAK